MKITNKSNKVIGIGSLTLLPNDTKDIPKELEGHSSLELYKSIGLVDISGKRTPVTEVVEPEEVNDITEDAEVLKKARLASLNGISQEDLAKLADELGVNMAECKDQADVKKKVRAALKA